MRLIAVLVVALAAPVAAAVAAAVAADEPNGLAAATALEQSLIAAIERAEQSVVAVARVRKPEDRAVVPSIPQLFREERDPSRPDFIPNEFGAGVVVDAAGLILTTAHVVGEPEHSEYVVWSRQRPFAARLLAADPWYDLAVLEVEADDLTPIAFGDGDATRKGQIVVALGNPYAIARDGDVNASWGIISNRLRTAPPVPRPRVNGGERPTLHHYGTLLQTDARLAFGYSGGALLNLQGEMIGLTTAYAAGPGYEQAAGFAIPVNGSFRRVVDQLKQGERPEYGFLGIAPELLSAEARRRGMAGVRVSSVFPGTPAAQAGIAAGDVVAQINKQPVYDEQDVIRLIASESPDAVVDILVHRGAAGGELQLTKVALSKKYALQVPFGTAPQTTWRGLRVDFATAAPTFQIDGPALDPSGCVYIAAVERDSSAWQAGLRAGLYITHVDRQRVTRPNEFYAAVERAGAGSVSLQVTSGRDQPAVRTVSP